MLFYVFKELFSLDFDSSSFKKINCIFVVNMPAIEVNCSKTIYQRNESLSD